jgi:hypothetical protein
VDRKLFKPSRRQGTAAAVAVAIGLAGCAPQGAGSIKIEPGARERAEAPGGAQSTKALTKKQAAAKENVEAAAKKNPKLY